VIAVCIFNGNLDTFDALQIKDVSSLELAGDRRRLLTMNKRNAQAAFLNLRVLIGLLIALTGVILALLSFGTFAVRAASMKQPAQSYTAKFIDALVPPGFDCSKIHELGIDKQMSFRAGAIMIACGQAPGGGTSAISPAWRNCRRGSRDC
jgi:hypothetical protein